MKFVYWFILSVPAVAGCSAGSTPIAQVLGSTAAAGKSADPPAWVNLDRAKLAQTVADYKGHLAEAVAASEELIKQDPDNSMNWYAAAALAAFNGNWHRADELIATGNRKPNAFDYQPTPFVILAFARLLEPMHGLMGLREAPLDAQRKSKFAVDIRTMAARVPTAQPPTEAAFYAAPGLRLGADLTLKSLGDPQWKKYWTADNAYFGVLDKALTGPTYLGIATLTKKYSLPKVGREVGPTTFGPDVQTRMQQASDEYEKQFDRVLRPLLDRMPK